MMYKGLHMDIFIRELKNMLSSVVVKSNKEASSYETIETYRAAEDYLKVRDGMDDFTSYVNFDPQVYRTIGITGALLSEYLNDKENIPHGLRNTLVRLQREFILQNYVEKNNYYRRLAGLPDLEDTQMVFCPTNDLGIPTNIPVHQLDGTSMSKLISSGIWEQLKKKYPEKKYLRFIGPHAIDVYVARKALNYDLLYIASTNPDNIGSEYKRYYSNAREYHMAALYNRDIAHTYKYYDNFMGLCITIMAIQRLFASVFKQGITRDFYDTQLIRYLFESYSIPYIEDLTLEQMKILAKNLNIFLALKSSTRVIFDLCTIFGFTNVTIFKYLLVKDHVLDAVTKKPIFPETTFIHSDGTIETKPDYEEMYDIYFQRVDVRSKDMNAALEDKANKVDYRALTASDIYWTDDKELRDKLYECNLNHIQSKYIGIEVMFRLTEIMYEINHFIRMMIDNNKEFRKVNIFIPKVSTKTHNLYAVTIFLCAMFCKRFGFTGEIPLKPAGVATVYGFNFHKDISLMRSEVLSNPLIDNSVTKFLTSTIVSSERDVDRLYSNIQDLKNFLVAQMAKTKDIKVYRAYRKLYNSTLVVTDKDVVYKKNDGTTAVTYMDLLQDIDGDLHLYVNEFQMGDTKYYVEIMEHVLYNLENLSSRLKHLHVAVESNGLFTALIKLIKFFKSYTVDFPSAGVLYLFDDRYFNMLKITDNLEFVNVNSEIESRVRKLYADMIAQMKVTIPLEDRLDIVDRYIKTTIKLLDDQLHIKDKLVETKVIHEKIADKIINQYADDFDMEIHMQKKSHILFISRVADVFYKWILSSRFKIHDKIMDTTTIQNFNDLLHIVAECAIVARVRYKDDLSLHDSVKYNQINTFKDRIRIKEDVTTMADMKVETQFIDRYADDMDMLIERVFEDKIKIKERVLKLEDGFSGVVNRLIKDKGLRLKDSSKSHVEHTIVDRGKLIQPYSDILTHKETTSHVSSKIRMRDTLMITRR